MTKINFPLWVSLGVRTLTFLFKRLCELVECDVLQISCLGCIIRAQKWVHLVLLVLNVPLKPLGGEVAGPTASLEQAVQTSVFLQVFLEIVVETAISCLLVPVLVFFHELVAALLDASLQLHRIA